MNLSYCIIYVKVSCSHRFTPYLSTFIEERDSPIWLILLSLSAKIKGTGGSSSNCGLKRLQQLARCRGSVFLSQKQPNEVRNLLQSLRTERVVFITCVKFFSHPKKLLNFFYRLSNPVLATGKYYMIAGEASLSRSVTPWRYSRIPTTATCYWADKNVYNSTY